jgi:hypothetical protein
MPHAGQNVSTRCLLLLVVSGRTLTINPGIAVTSEMWRLALGVSSELCSSVPHWQMQVPSWHHDGAISSAACLVIVTTPIAVIDLLFRP